MDSENTQTVLLFLSAVGGIALLRYVYSVLSFLYSTFLSGGVNVKKLGSWAVVTVRPESFPSLCLSFLTAPSNIDCREQRMESERLSPRSLPSVASTLSSCPALLFGKTNMLHTVSL